jgi:transposase-like protein
MRKILNPYQKAKLALAAFKGDKTFVELSSEHQVHPSQLSDWKKILEKEAHSLFGPSSKSKEEQRIAQLERMIGQREAEIEWLKKISRSLPQVTKNRSLTKQIQFFQ